MSASSVSIGGLLTWNAAALDRLQRNLRAYEKVRVKKTSDEILNEKGGRLRIELWRAFWKRRFVKSKTSWERVLKRLVKRGKGIKVRLQNLGNPWAARVPQTNKHGKPTTLRQKLVAQEIMRRVSGSGVLGASFLIKRWKKTKEDKYLIENRTRGLGKAVTFQKTAKAFIVTGFTPGLAAVAQKYGALAEAINAISADTEAYLLRKCGPDFVKALHA